MFSDLVYRSSMPSIERGAQVLVSIAVWFTAIGSFSSTSSPEIALSASGGRYVLCTLY